MNGTVLAQVIPLDMRQDDGVMDILDEWNNLRLTNTSLITQPLSRRSVIQLLDTAAIDQLNDRQLKERTFYQLAFSKDRNAEERPFIERWFTSPLKGLNRFKQPDLAYFHQDEATITINPIIGGTYWSNQNGVNWQRRVGADLQAYFGRVGLYGSVRDVYELKPMAQDSLLTPQEGAIYKFNSDGSREFSETRGGITYSWDGGYVGLVRDYVQWGYGYYGSNIFGINTPPFAHLKLHLSPIEWFQYDYIHGSLQSGVIDSSSIISTAGASTVDFYNKFIAANLISVRPWKSLWLSAGNSIIYSKNTPELTYMVPLMFYKSADHFLGARANRAGGSGNSQMFAAASFRPGAGLHLYSTLFVDEVSFRRMFDPDLHTNWFSLKSGVRWTNFLPNTTLTFEHLRSNPMVYKHYDPTTTFQNAEYSMGHYLGDNAREFILALRYKPYYWLTLEGRYQFAQKGTDFPDDRTLRDPVTGEYLIRGRKYLDKTTWLQTVYSLRAVAQPIYRLKFSASLDKVQRPVENASYQVPYMRGSGWTWSFGAHFGF